MNLYNEVDPFAAAWLRNLSSAGKIAGGSIDDRSIADLTADDVVGLRQFHTFAGIGGWSLALRLAGVSDDAPVWTGSCPCQPFSQAGRRGGTSDARHLWPEWRRLIEVGRPPVLFGEQVASADGRAWFASVRADLEALGYAVGCADLCAAGVGAPHIRQRLFFGAVRVADARHGDESHRFQMGGAEGEAGEEVRHQRVRTDAGDGGVPEFVGHPLRSQLEGRPREPGDDGPERPPAQRAGGDAGGVADAHSGQRDGSGWRSGRGSESPDGGGPDAIAGPWADCAWIPCRDGKARPVEPRTQPLAHGVPGRVGLLRGYGNAIVAQVGASFVVAFLEAAGLR